MAVYMCKTITNSQIQNYQLVVIHSNHRGIHITKLSWRCVNAEIHRDVESGRGKNNPGQ